ncbi:MAG: VCBS repeat-containing protein [Planctomycetes bacterium]|nr:VCBS repeat-containing protein [Planctomycetota bacterium]
MNLWRWWKNGTRPNPARTARLRLEAMETREVPAAMPDAVALVGNSPAGSVVSLVNPNGTAIRNLLPFPGFTGGVVAAAGDVNHDGTADVIVGAQRASGFVAVFDGATGNVLSARATLPGYTGTIGVGSADLDGDHFADVLVGANAPGAPVLAFGGRDGAMLSGFLATPGFSAPISLSGADFDRDGRDEIIVGAGLGGAVLVYRPDGSRASTTFALPGFVGPVSVAAGDVTGDGVPEIIVGAGAGAPAGLTVELNASGGTNLVLTPVSSGYRGGAVVGVGDADGDGRRDILLALANEQLTGIWPFDGTSGELLNYTPDTSVPVEL